jgi:hypothetical protein
MRTANFVKGIQVLLSTLFMYATESHFLLQIYLMSDLSGLLRL